MTDLDTLRADYLTVRAWMVKCEEWTADEAAEIGTAIADAVQRQDAGELAFWGEWMARYALVAKAHESQMQALEREAVVWWAEQKRRAA
jgi:hypothetical protein